MTESRPDEISSVRNTRIQAFLNLGKRRERDRTGLFTIEGIREISRAFENGIGISEIFYCQAIVDGTDAAPLLERISSTGCPAFSVSPRIFERIAYRGSTGGIAVTADRPGTGLDRLPETDLPLYIVVDGIEKPGNQGAVLRSADGAGITGLILTGEGTDLFNPNTVRASLGTVFTVPVATASATDAIEWLRSRDVSIAVSTPDAGLIYTEADLTERCALILGSESHGAGDEWIEAADIRITIPMLGVADSLNVSASASILAYEALRQRGSA